MGLGEALAQVVSPLALGERFLSGDRQGVFAERMRPNLAPEQMLAAVEGLVSHILRHPDVKPTDKAIDALVFACSYHSDNSSPERSSMGASARGWAADCLGTYRDQLEGRHAILLAQALDKELTHMPDPSSEIPQRLAEIMVAAGKKLSPSESKFELRLCRDALEVAKSYLGVSYESLASQIT